MVDFHTHILPNIDDGSRSVEETFNLIKEAEEAGFDKIISTSHYMENYYEVENKEREFWIDSISKKFKEQGINVNIYLGNEIYLTENIIKLLEDGKASTINNTSYVLFEMPMAAEPMNLYDTVFEMLKCKLVPILAHPERYSYVQDDPELVCDLLQKGVLMQCNYGSIEGMYGKRAQILVKKFLQNNMVQFLGSDVHREGTVYPKIHEILDKIKDIVGEEKLMELTTRNPELVLGNKKVPVVEPRSIKFSLKERIKMKLER